MAAVPYVVGGRVRQSDGVTPSANNNLVLRYEPSNEFLFTTTDVNGDYAFDLANLTSYTDGDYFIIVATGSTSIVQDLRLRIIARDIAQISEIKVKYSTT